MTGYFYTYNAIFDAPVSGSAKLAYAYLCKCADPDGKSYPSHKAIAAAISACVSTVKKAISELDLEGFIAVRGQARPDSGRRANIYTVIKDSVKGFFVTYANVFIRTLTAKARLVYLYFCRLGSGRDQAYPAHSTTAKACGLSVSGARLAIDELEAAGLVSRQAQYRDNGGQRANLYTLTEPQETDGESSAGGARSIETENLVGLHTERAGDPVNGDNGQTVDGSALQVADSGITQIGFLGQFKLAHAALFAEELDFEPDVFQKLIFFLRIRFSADRHLLSSLRKCVMTAITILRKRGLRLNEAKRYNIVVIQHHKKCKLPGYERKPPPGEPNTGP
jgi:predicted transcriptional regulator